MRAHRTATTEAQRLTALQPACSWDPVVKRWTVPAAALQMCNVWVCQARRARGGVLGQQS